MTQEVDQILTVIFLGKNKKPLGSRGAQTQEATSHLLRCPTHLCNTKSAPIMSVKVSH